ncbi:hypothetical protein ANO11243_093700 [Dothideomycetidae sp. 11243]|nr:hypothetical protein ANO11243_093700 [fungal sp. No.11243]
MNGTRLLYTLYSPYLRRSPAVACRRRSRNADVAMEFGSTAHSCSLLPHRHLQLIFFRFGKPDFLRLWLQSRRNLGGTSERQMMAAVVSLLAIMLTMMAILLSAASWFASSNDDRNIYIFDAETGALAKTLSGHEGAVWALAREGETLVSVSTDRSGRVWDLKTGRCTRRLLGHTNTVRCVETVKQKPAGDEKDLQSYIVTGSRDATLRIWDLSDADAAENSDPVSSVEPVDQRALHVLSGHEASVRVIAAHADIVVSGSYDSTVIAWRISTGKMLRRMCGHTAKIYSIALDHEHSRCISGSMDRDIKIWSLTSGECLRTLSGHTSLVSLLALEHGLLVSAAADSTLRIWDLETGVCRHKLVGHGGAVTCLQHDGTTIVSGGDREVKLWDAQCGCFVRDLVTDVHGVWQVAFDAGRYVAAIARDGVTFLEVMSHRER